MVAIWTPDMGDPEDRLCERLRTVPFDGSYEGIDLLHRGMDQTFAMYDLELREMNRVLRKQQQKRDKKRKRGLLSWLIRIGNRRKVMTIGGSGNRVGLGPSLDDTHHDLPALPGADRSADHRSAMMAAQVQSIVRDLDVRPDEPRRLTTAAVLNGIRNEVVKGNIRLGWFGTLCLVVLPLLFMGAAAGWFFSPRMEEIIPAQFTQRDAIKDLRGVFRGDVAALNAANVQRELESGTGMLFPEGYVSEDVGENDRVALLRLRAELDRQLFAKLRGGIAAVGPWRVIRDGFARDTVQCPNDTEIHKCIDVDQRWPER